VDALGNIASKDAAPDHSEGDIFNATYNISGFPEYYWAGYQTETLVRDASPFEDYINGICHGRYCRGKADPTPMWVTEVNMGPGECFSWGRTDGKQITDQAALSMKAKIVTRFMTFFPHKGVERVYLYNDVSNMAIGRGDTGLAVIGDKFINFTLAAAAAGAPFPDSGKKTHLFAPFYTQNASFYHDRLGTNIGKALKKEAGVFLQMLRRPSARRRCSHWLFSMRY
jgi:hypothetical protein